MKSASVATQRSRGTRKSPLPARAINRPAYTRRMPIGAEIMPDGGAHFRVWAPESKKVRVELFPNGNSTSEAPKAFDLARDKQGYFAAAVRDAGPGMLYRYQLDSGSFPDPASHFQPEGPHGPSQIIDPSTFKWTDHNWRGVPEEGLVIYEMHIGTYTPEGTYVAAAEHLSELAEFGVNLIEVMPVAEFPGRFGWGYDGVNLFAPTRLYGNPDDLRSFVNRAHNLGIGVILDVVYNHLGPDGNYLKHFAQHYFTDRHKNEWGQAINFDDKDSGPVREFFATNAGYWIEEFHMDGLRLDATQQIFDCSEEHILSLINKAAREAARGRRIHLVAENESQNVKLVKRTAERGYGLDALWNDDFHHSARVALTGKREAYYSDYKGSPQELISAIKRGFLYQGQWYAWQGKQRGISTLGLKPANFVHFIENHDQVANSLHGRRIWQLTSPGDFKAMTALLLLGPETPMLFQGQEFAASAPFVYFADHNPELARLVAAGRKEFLHQFRSIACPEADPLVRDPGSEQTFLRCKLDHSEREKNSEIYQFHRDLLQIRREDPVFSRAHSGLFDGAVLSAQALVLRFFGAEGDDRLLLENFGCDLRLSPIPEPLLAPPENASWKLKWSSEAVCYGGCSIAPLQMDDTWELPGHAALVLEPVKELQG